LRGVLAAEAEKPAERFSLRRVQVMQTTRAKTRAATPIAGQNKCASDRRPSECGTCFKMSELREIRDAYFAETGVKVPGRSACELYDGLLDKLSCTKDRCVIRKLGVRPELRKKLRDALVPVAPRAWRENPTAWLSDHDIHAKVRELVRNKKYRFYGVLPMDFEAVDSRLAALDAAAVRDSSSPKFVMVLNTDYDNMPGSHWVSLIGYLKPSDPRHGFYYYDSNGNKPTPEVDRFVARLSDELGGAPPYQYNDTKHQRSSTECGMFCISFVDAMVNSRLSFADTCRQMEGDDEMVRRRTVYFELP
jgi:hypothetical protein